LASLRIRPAAIQCPNALGKCSLAVSAANRRCVISGVFNSLNAIAHPTSYMHILAHQQIMTQHFDDWQTPFALSD
jgi:hypothetical protein